MGGLHVLGWLAVGAAAGWTITRLMVTAQGHAVRGTAAGILGGILGGLGMELFESPWARANGLDTLLAALAASLWLAWITCAVTSGRERRARHHALMMPPFDVHTHGALGAGVQPLSSSVGPG